MKENSISQIRLIAMIMIITCHIFQQMNNELAWWFNVGVQIFFTMSGFLYGRKIIGNPWKWIKHNFYKILLDYYIYIILIILIYFIFAKDLINFDLILANVFCVTGFRQGIAGIEHLWYITYILICYLITPLLQSFYEQLKDKSEITFWVTLLLVVVIGEIYQAYGLINTYIPRITCYIFGYFIAKRYSNNSDESKNEQIRDEKCYNKLTLSSLTLILIIITLIMNIFKIYVKYIGHIELTGFISKFINLIFDYTHSLLGITLFFTMYWLFSKILSNKSEKKGILYYSDKYSYDVYIVHQIYILGVFSLISLTEYLSLNILIIAILIIISAVLLHITVKGISFIFSKISKSKRLP